ncbi:hypothetical protein [Crenobacter cavernae]|uniref:hypothetical protein n=1 Tax=Crenobacter cavernae TaxID=2290923 RepID=UPI0014196564|nr:hypothetical protein [Crenobacter cavernae]
MQKVVVAAVLAQVCAGAFAARGDILFGAGARFRRLANPFPDEAHPAVRLCRA